MRRESENPVYVFTLVYDLKRIMRILASFKIVTRTIRSL